jgi:predicted DNA-binding mobile mystery protein A
MRAIRDAIGMSGVQLAKKLGVRPQTIEAFERSEATGAIQLKTLRRAAEALDCTLVYALVPKASLGKPWPGAPGRSHCGICGASPTR